MLWTVLARLVVAASCAAGAGTQTFVVDSSNGPGTHFTSLAVAAAVVPDGATLAVRPGIYSATVVSGKGLTIRGGPGVFVQGLSFSGLSPSQDAIVQNLTMVLHLSIATLEFQNCQGRVHVERCGFDVGAQLWVTQCPMAMVVASYFSGNGSAFAQSDVVCTGTTFSGGTTGAIGLSITGGSTQLAKCDVAGNSSPFGLPTAAISMNGGSLRLLGPCAITGGGSGAAPATSGAGTVRVSPTVTLTGTAIPFVTVDEATTSSVGGSVGGIVTGTVVGSSNLLAGLLLGTTLPPVTIPGIAEELWVNPFGFMTIGALGPPLSYTATIPNDPLLTGAVFGWQGMTWSPTAGFVLGNPAWFCVQ